MNVRLYNANPEQNLMKGYLNRPEETANFFAEDGFVHTGDLAHYNEKGVLFFDGRHKDLIKFKNYHIYPLEIENVLCSHKDILEAGVFGRPDPLVQEYVTAVVVKVPGSNVTEEEIFDLVAENLDDSKKLRGGIIFVDELPKNPQGKILRRKLAELNLAKLKTSLSASMPGPSSSKKIAPELSAAQKEKRERKNLVPLDLPFQPLDWKDWNSRRSIRLQNIAETSFKTYSRKEHLTSIDFDEYNVPDLDNVFQSLDWNQDQIEAEHVDMAELLDEVVEDQQVHVEVPIPDGNWRGQVRSDGRVFYIGNETNSLDETSVQLSEETDTSIEILGENDSDPIAMKESTKGQKIRKLKYP